MSGPSKYDGLAREMCETLDAEAVVVIVIGGRYGSGACRAERAGGPTPPAELRALLSRGLRALADTVDQDSEPRLIPRMVCVACWNAGNPERPAPAYVRDDADYNEPEACCRCGKATSCGIYLLAPA